MADNNLEITYIPYGLDEISQLDLMTNLANGVEGYLGSKRWARKDKYRNAWLAAYLDIIGHGLTGASNDSGVWTVNHNGEAIPFDTKSEIEKEMYQDAAYYIQLQMAKMTPRKKEEEKKKEDLTPFKFKESFGKQLLNLYGGDRDIFTSPEQGWNTLDARGANGLRGTTERKKVMAELLKLYKLKLEGKDYNFEGTSFKDKLDALNKIQAAIDALGTEEESDDLPAFSALGLNYRGFFSNGGNEASTHINPATNTPFTYNEWNLYQLQLAEAKAKLAKQNAYNNTLFLNRVTNPKMFGQNAKALKEKYKDSNSLLTALQGYSQKDIRTLSPDELSEVQGAYRYLAKLPIDNELLRKLQSSSSGLYKNAAPNRFRKIQGIDNLIWDSVAGQVIQINTRQLQQAVLNLPQNLFAGVLTLLEVLNTPISKEGWTSADTADVVSMVGDLVSLGGFWANIGGTATSLTSDLYADISRDKNLGDILKGVGVNLGWGLAGMLPGAKSTKLVARAARLVPKAWMLAQSAGIVMDPEVQKSAMKFTTVDGLKTVSSKDLENLKYLFHAVTGGTNIAKSHFRAKQYRETINKLSVKTADGKTIKLSNKEVAEVNKAGRKGGLKAALKKFEEYAKAEAAEGQFKFSENGKSKFNPTRYSSYLSKFTSNDLLLKGEKTTDLRAISNILKEDANKPWYNWNKGYSKFELTPFRHFSNYKNTSTLQNNNSKEHFPIELSDKDLKIILNAYNPPEHKLRRESKMITPKNSKVDGKLIDGSDYKVTFGGTNNETMTIEYKGEIIPIEGKTLGESKKNLGLWIQLLNNKILQLTLSILRTKDSKWKDFVKSIKDLKRKGYLYKLGGQINPSLDTIIEDFIKNNNI